MDEPPRKKRKRPRRAEQREKAAVRAAAPPPQKTQGERAKLGLQKVGKGQFVFVPPDVVEERLVDLDEVRQMMAGDELEIARDELLYLVSDCRAFLDAHNLLAELALEENDIKLARGHFGFAYEIGLESLPTGFNGRLPAKQGYNPQFHHAGRGLARCLIALGQPADGREVLLKLLQFDPQEPTARTLLDELAAREKAPQ